MTCFRGHAPKSEPIRLRVQELIQFIEAARIAWPAIDLSERLFDRLLYLRRLLTAPLEPAFDDFLFARALGDAFRIGLGAPLQILERRDDALQFSVKTFAFVFGEIFQRDLENVPIRAGRDRKFAVVIPKIK